MQGSGGEQHPTHAQGLDQRLRGRDLLRCTTDLLVRQDQRRLAGERAQHVRRRPIVQMVEAALEGLAV